MREKDSAPEEYAYERTRDETEGRVATPPAYQSSHYQPMLQTELFDTDGGNRGEKVARLNRLCDRLLPGAAESSDYPVTDDHCFRRIAYDAAVEARWDSVVARPFVRHATAAQLDAAVRAAARMLDDPGEAARLHRASLGFRSGSDS